MTSEITGTRRSLTTGEVAALCEVTLGAVKKWIRAGKLRASRTPGGHFRIAFDEFERFRATYRFPARRAVEARILVVDDNHDIVELICDSLRTLRPSPRLDSASDGYWGLLKVGTFRPHLLVLDINLPGLDGYEVCRRIKADPVIQATRILAITGDDSGGSRERALAAGADAFLAKPLDLAELKDQVRRLLRVGERGTR